MTQQLLDLMDLRCLQQKMSREAVAQRVDAFERSVKSLVLDALDKDVAFPPLSLCHAKTCRIDEAVHPMDCF